VAIKRAEFELSPENLTLLRWIIASGSFLILAPVIGKPKRPIQRNHVPRILLVSFASVVGYHFTLNYAETIVSAGLAGLLISFGPIFIALLSTIFLKEKVSGLLILALALALAGTFTLSIGADLTFRQIVGPVAMIIAAFMYSVLCRVEATRERVWGTSYRSVACGDRNGFHVSIILIQFRRTDLGSIYHRMAFCDLSGNSKYGNCKHDPLHANR